MGYFSFYRELWRLLREAPRNMLITKYPPWKSDMWRRCFFFLQLCFVPGWVGWCILYVKYTPSNGSWFGPDFTVFILSAVFLACFGSCASMPINFIVYQHPALNEKDRLEELATTPISYKNLAFASVFWSIICGSLVPFAGVLGTLTLILQGGYPAISVACIGVLCIVGNAIVSVFWKLRLRGRVLLMLLLAPLTSVLVGYWCMGFALLAVESFGNLDSNQQELSIYFLLFLICALRLAPIAGKLAGTRLMASVDGDSLVRRSYFASMMAIRRRPDIHAELDQRLKQVVTVSKGRMAALGVVFGLCILLAAIFLQFVARGEAELVSNLLIPGIHFAVCAFVLRKLFAPDAPKVMIPGTLWRMLTRPTRPFSAAAAMVLLLAAPVLAGLEAILPIDSLQEYAYGEFSECARMSLFMSAGVAVMWLVATPSWLAFCYLAKRPQVRLLWLSILVAVISILVPVLSLLYYQSFTDGWHEGWNPFFLPIGYYVILSPILLLTVFQRNHEKHAMKSVLVGQRVES